MANYSFADPTDIPDGSTISSGNFTQLLPGTEIMVGKALVITGGNWTNVKRQPEWVVTGGNWTQISRCSHLHPGLVQQGLPVCPEDCAHQIEFEDIVVDGVVVDTISRYEDTIL